MDELHTSKSERKREAKRTQEMGLKLTKLNARQFGQIPLTDDLTHAFAEYRRITSNAAKRRQLQFISKLIRSADVAAIQAALSLAEGKSAQARYKTHQLETWRDRLTGDDSAVTAYLRENPTVDRQLLRHHVSKARNATIGIQQRKASRSLFRFLRESALAQTSDHED